MIVDLGRLGKAGLKVACQTLNFTGQTLIADGIEGVQRAICNRTSCVSGIQLFVQLLCLAHHSLAQPIRQTLSTCPCAAMMCHAL
jgi:hypothetical protein